MPKLISGFPPVARPDAKILILGSMPSEESLRAQQYYAHPRNGFWRIMMTLLGEISQQPYVQRTAVLIKNRIALWDVLASCERSGSLDTAIVGESEVVNDFNGFFSHHPQIRHVFFNGRKAEQVYRGRVLPTLSAEWQSLHYYCMPSTSPAMASLGFEQKLEQWRRVVNV